MILVAGGTGTLGSRIVGRLVADGTPVRVLTRAAERAAALARADVAIGDVRDLTSLSSAMRGVHTVVSAVQGFAGVEPVGGKAVDRDGNQNLVRAAVEAGVRRFVLVSASGAAPDSALDLRRFKFEAEQAVRASGLEWCIVRPTVFLETWLWLLGEMAETKGSIMLFGRGENPINFVSADDVAALAVLACDSEVARGAALEIGGPEDITLSDLASRVLAGRGRAVKVRHVPLLVPRLVSVVAAPVKPTIASIARFGVVMDTMDMTLGHDSARAAFPDLPLTTLDAVLARGAASSA